MRRLFLPTAAIVLVLISAWPATAKDPRLRAKINGPQPQMSFNQQYLQLQNQMQNENRQYSAVSNIMKTKHDTVKNTIRNIR